MIHIELATFMSDMAKSLLDGFDLTPGLSTPT